MGVSRTAPLRSASANYKINKLVLCCFVKAVLLRDRFLSQGPVDCLARREDGTQRSSRQT